jgi:RNA polymerase sigma factor (sigma-70 family)
LDNTRVYTEKEIIDGCRTSQRIFQEALYRNFAKKMFSVCLAYAKDRSAAKDILQEGFLKIFAKIDQYDNTGSLEGWVRKVITNTAIDHFRKHQREDVFVKMDSGNQETAIHNEMLEKINADELLYFLERLPYGARMVFNLYALEGYLHKEIAHKLGISEGTSKSQFNRAKSLLQEMIFKHKSLEVG